MSIFGVEMGVGAAEGGGKTKGDRRRMKTEGRRRRTDDGRNEVGPR